MYREPGNRRGEVDTLSNLARIHAAQGQLDQATVVFEEQLSLAKDLSYPSGEADARLELAEIYVEQDKVD